MIKTVEVPGSWQKTVKTNEQKGHCGHVCSRWLLMSMEGYRKGEKYKNNRIEGRKIHIQLLNYSKQSTLCRACSGFHITGSRWKEIA